jgi:hypothetical protein
VAITSPPNGATESTTPITVTGTVSDTVAIASVTVNGVAATVNNGTWSATVGLTSGSTTITATAIDGAGVKGKASVIVHYSP